MKPVRVIFYGNFGSGNLGNECTLQAAIEQTLQRWPAAQLECFCTIPEDVRVRHQITAYRSVVNPAEWSWDALDRQAGLTAAPGLLQSTPRPILEAGPVSSPAAATGAAAQRRGLVARVLRLLFHRIPLEIAHWISCLRIVRGSDLLVVPGTQIVSDYLCGPMSWPYDIFKFSTLAALCRVRLAFLSIGVGPIRHPLSRWFIKRSLGFAHYRSYRDAASKQYMEDIGFSTAGDPILPDLVFGLSPRHLAAAVGLDEPRRTIGLGLKDYFGASNQAGAEAYRAYLEAMASFVLWLCANDYRVRLLIGDVQYDTRVRQDLLELLQSRNPSPKPLPVVAEAALDEQALLRQLAETDAVISPRFHNLILALMLNKPVIALSDHAKLDSLLDGLGLAQYLVPLDGLEPDALISRFRALQADTGRLRPYIKQAVNRYRTALEQQYASV
jgi:polysaccharide pyruvyl transferase WcaK-like protein